MYKGILASAAGVALEFGVPKGQDCLCLCLRDADSTMTDSCALCGTYSSPRNYTGTLPPRGREMRATMSSRVGWSAFSNRSRSATKSLSLPRREICANHPTGSKEKGGPFLN